MAYIIGDACISCGACESECPVECISAGDDKYTRLYWGLLFILSRTLGAAIRGTHRVMSMETSSKSATRSTASRAKVWSICHALKGTSIMRYAA